jgi:hypothetical protein
MLLSPSTRPTVLGSTLRSGNHEQIRTPSRLRSFPPNIFNRS